MSKIKKKYILCSLLILLLVWIIWDGRVLLIPKYYIPFRDVVFKNIKIQYHPGWRLKEISTNQKEIGLEKFNIKKPDIVLCTIVFKDFVLSDEMIRRIEKRFTTDGLNIVFSGPTSFNDIKELYQLTVYGDDYYTSYIYIPQFSVIIDFIYSNFALFQVAYRELEEMIEFIE